MIPFSGEIFDKVLYRNTDEELWKASLYAGCQHRTISYEETRFCQFVTSEKDAVEQIIPYNDETAKLLFTKNEPPYKFRFRGEWQEKKPELTTEGIYAVIESCLRHNNIYTFTYMAEEKLIQETNCSTLNKDDVDKAMYALTNGGLLEIHKIQCIIRGNERIIFPSFDAELLTRIMQFLWENSDEFMEYFTDILLDEENTFTPKNTYNTVLDMLVETHANIE